jgi:hypothetical protein
MGRQGTRYALHALIAREVVGNGKYNASFQIGLQIGCGAKCRKKFLICWWTI